MKKALFNFMLIVIGGLCFLALGAVIIFGIAFVGKFFVLSYLIDHGTFDSPDDYWKLISQMYFILVIPPFYFGLFRMIPYEEQNAIKEVACAGGLALLHIGDWIAKGILLCFGANIFFLTFSA